MGKVVLLFVVLPAVELALLIEIGTRIGTFETLALIVVTGVVGAALARTQGLRVLSKIQQQVAAGEMPGESMLDGMMILIASALLITPGVLTDLFGFACLTPAFRRIVRREIVRRFEESIARGTMHVEVDLDGEHRSYTSGAPGSGRVIDVTPNTTRKAASDSAPRPRNGGPPR